jgi:hypothetical protein
MLRAKIGTLILAGTFIMAAAIPTTALAGPGGKMRGNSLQTQNQTTLQSGQRLRLRDGSCVDPAKARSSAMEKRGNTYGTGGGTGNAGIGPKDGTGYGAPSQR